jgi:hypothetical protein
MQATTRATSFTLVHLKVMLAGVGLIAAIGIALAVAAITSGSDAGTQDVLGSRIVRADVKTSANPRFMELYALPEPQRVSPLSMAHMLAINALPGDDVAPAGTPFARQRFLDINVLPGDDVPFLPPSTDQRGSTY